MAITVPVFPPNFGYATAGTSTKNTIRAAHPVRATHWTDMANGVNWLHGRGGTLVSAAPYYSLIGAGSSAGFNYYVWPRYENPHRLWCVLIYTEDEDSAFGTITSNSAVADWVADGSTNASFGGVPTIAYLREDVTPSATPAGVLITIAVNSASGGGVWVGGVSLHELPRTVLDAGYGADLSSVASRQPIYWTGSGDVSLEAVHRHQRGAKTVARKNHLFSWWNATGVTETGTSFVDLWATNPYISCRHLESANTSRTVAWTAYTVCAAASSGEIRMTPTGGGSTDTMSFNNTVPAWQTPRTMTVNTEDPSRWLTDGGLRSGTGDSFMAAIRRVTGTSATVLGLCIGEST